MRAARIMKSFALLLLVSALTPSLVFGQGTLAGYEFETDVSEHAKLDVDQQAMDQQTTDYQWSEAKDTYVNGGNSMKNGGKPRTLQGFSTDAGEKMKGEGYYHLFRNYYKSNDYGNQFIVDALDGNGDFENRGRGMRSECANKGSQYQNVWMYVIHEMEDAISDCQNSAPNDNDDPKVSAWDEAWAFYAGSLVGEEGLGAGFMIYTLAQKRCTDFGTCDNGVAKINREIRDLMKNGRDSLDDDRCTDVVETKNKIVRLMTVPLIQGILRYVTLTKKAEPVTEGKEHGEGWAFARAALPLIDHCDEGVAKRLIKNFEPSADPPMSDSVDDVANDVYKVLGCLGITCEQLGDAWEGLPDCSTSGDLEPVPFTDKTSKDNIAAGDAIALEGADGESTTSGSGGSGSGGSGSNDSNSTGSSDDDGGLSGGAKAGIAIAVIALILVAGLLGWRFLKKRSKPPIEPLGEPAGGVMA